MHRRRCAYTSGRALRNPHTGMEGMEPSEQSQKIESVKVTRLIRKLINQRANALAQTEQSTWVGRMIEEVADGRLRIEDIQRWRP